MQRLPGIINIYYVLASSLMASITQKALADAPVGVFADTFLIPHIGDAPDFVIAYPKNLRQRV